MKNTTQYFLWVLNLLLLYAIAILELILWHKYKTREKSIKRNQAK